jgi:hypothetical protein
VLYWHGFVQSTFTLLSRITSPLVEHVSLTISVYCDVDWARLDRLLTQQRWANLRRLSVRRIATPPGLADLPQTHLPILESRGVVLDLGVLEFPIGMRMVFTPLEYKINDFFFRYKGI